MEGREGRDGLFRGHRLSPSVCRAKTRVIHLPRYAGEENYSHLPLIQRDVPERAELAPHFLLHADAVESERFV